MNPPRRPPVLAVLVSHNGARWLPGVLGALDASTVLPSAVVAVDAGSEDDSVALVEQALGPGVLRLPPTTGYAEAVGAALADAPAEPDQWVWLLHDDAAPDPRCLEVLLDAAAEAPERIGAIGPKLREWPSLRRLLEVGVTIAGTGRRETGLETGEYDQGQHDDIRQVLAVNTAGMLVRRTVLDEVGLDPRLPVLGTDLDFGWRAALAGHETVVLPDAVAFHAEAAHRGQRTSALTRSPRRDERAAAIYTLLVNGPAWAMPLRWLRLLLGGLLRVLGLLLVRAVPEAREELAGLARGLLRVDRVLAGRKARRGRRVVRRREVRALLAPPWLPYRHGLDFVTDVAGGIAQWGRESAAKRSGRPVDEVGIVSGVVRSPLLWTFVGGLVLALVAGRDVLSGDPLHGGALLAAPEHVSHWWRMWTASWHWLGSGTSASGPAYLLPLALAGTVLLGHPGWVVWWLFLLGVPLAMFGAYRLLRRVAPGRWAPLWGALAYALVPVASGIVAQGRLGTVAGTILAPWVARSALELAGSTSERRARATWRTALGAGILVAFVPPAFFLIAVLVLAAPLWSRVRLRPGQVAALLLTPLLMVLPWLVGTLGTPGAWLVEAGRAAAVPVQPGVRDLLLGRTGGHGAAPEWIGLGLPLAGLVALVRRDTRARVLRVWVVIAAAALELAVLSRIEISLPGVDASFRPWAGFFVVVMQGGFVVAAAIAAGGALGVVSAERFGWRQPVAGIALIAALATPLLGAVWWLGHGSEGPLHRSQPSILPAYMGELAANRHTSAVLVLSGGRGGDPIRYQLLRSGEPRLGDDGVLALTAPDTALTSTVQQVLSSDNAGREAAQRLASYGVAYVYAPAPVSSTVSAALDAAAGFAGASAPAHGARAWQLQPRATLAALSPQRHWTHFLWAGLQALTYLVVVVLALPSRVADRRREDVS